MNLVRLIEVCEQSARASPSEIKYVLREVLVNPEYVVALRESAVFKERLKRGCFPEDLDKRQEFTKLQLNLGSGQSSATINIVGDMSTVAEKLLLEVSS